MASTDLRFDITALDQASRTFIKIAAAVERLERKLDELDGKRIDVDVEVNTKEADRDVGRFATDMRRTLAAAIKSLPDIRIDGDSTPAQREIARIRSELQSLADKRIGVDIDSGAAQAKVAELQRQLRDLGSGSTDVQVQADTAAASAQLAAISGEVDRLDGRTAKIKVDVDKSLSASLIQVAQLGRALSTLALPAAIVAATPQLASLGSAAVSASGAFALLPAVLGATGLAVGTLVTGFSNLGDALGPSGTPAQLKKVDEALAKLAPSALTLVQELRTLAPAWSALQLDVQERLFTGVGAAVQQLAGAYLPPLRSAMAGVAAGFSAAFVQVSKFLTAPATVARVSTALDQMKTAVVNASGALAPLTRAFTTLVTVGASRLPQLGQAITNVSEKFAAFIERTAQSGQLGAFIDRGIATITQLGRIVGNVGSILMSVFTAADQAGVSFLGTVEQITSGVKDFLNSVEGQATVAGFFRGIKDVVTELLPGIKALALAVVDVITKLGNAGVFTGIAKALSAIAVAAGPVLSILGRLASVVLPPLLAIVSLLAPALVPLAAALIALKLATAGLASIRALPGWLMSSRAAAVGATGATEKLGTAMTTLSGAARRVGADMRTSYQGASQAVRGFATTAGAAANAASTALGERLAQAAQRGVDGLLRIPAAARSAASTLKTGLGVAAIDTAQALQRLPAVITSVAGTLKTGIGVAAISAAQSLQRLPAAASSAAATLRTGLGVAAISAGESLKRIGTSAVEAGRSIATGLQAGVATSVAGLRQLGPAAVSAGQSLATGLRSGVTAAATAVQALPARVGSAMTATGQAVTSGLRAIPDGVRTAFSSFGSAVQTGIGHLGRFTGALAGVGGAVSSGLMRAGSSLVGFLGGPWGVALAAAGVALSIFASRQQEAAAAAADHKAKVEGLKGTLDQYSGSITQATRMEQAKDISARKLADGTTSFATALVAAGIGLGDYTNAASGNEQALAKVNGQLVAAAARLPEVQTLYASMKGELDGAGVSFDTFTAAAIGNGDALNQVSSALGLSSETVRVLLSNAAGGVGQLGSALGVYSGQVAEAGQQTRDAATAAGDFGNTLKTITPGLAGLRDGAAPTQLMAAAFKDLSSAASEGASSAGQAAAAYGGTAAGADAAAAAMQGSRDAFISAATGAGLTADAAGRLADQIGLVPASARTQFESNAPEVATQMQGVKAAFDAVPGSKSVTVEASSISGARTQLESLGFTITTLPDGRVTITAPTDAAKAGLDAFVGAANTQKATIPIAANDAPARGTLTSLLGTVFSARPGPIPLAANDAPARGTHTGFMGLVNAAIGRSTIGANDAPARGTHTGFMGLVNAARGISTILGNAAPAQGTLSGLVGSYNAASGTSRILANAGPAQGTLSGFLGQANSSSGTSTIRAQDGPARGTLSGFVGAVTSASGTSTIRAQDGPARGTLGSLVGSINGASGTIGINGRDNGVAALKARLSAPSSSTHTINVRQVGGSVGGTIRAAGAYATPAAYAQGGMRRMGAGRAEIVPPRQPRIIGDRMRGDEAFIPINSSGRSQQILAMAAGRMGWDLAQKGMGTARAAVASAAQSPLRSVISQPRTAGAPGLSLGPMLARLDRLRDAILAAGDDNTAVVAEVRSQTAALVAVLKAGTSASVTSAVGRARSELGGVRVTDSWVINGTTLGNVASRIEVAQDLQTTPERVDDTLPIPGTHGVLDLGLLRYGPGTITFRMWVKGVNPTTGLFVGTGEAEYFARVDELVNLFSARTLLVDHVRSDGTRRATARLSGELKFDRERSVPLFGRFTATLLIPGAFWVGTADVTASGTVATGATISLAAFAPSNAPISDGTVTFGPCSNPTLYTSGGATFVAYDGIITAGRQLTINSADWSLGAGSGTAWTPSMSVLRYGPGPTWFEVDPTGALTVTFAHTGGGTAFASFTGRQKWLTA